MEDKTIKDFEGNSKTVKNYVVLGLFRTALDLENAVEQLRENGFRNSDISAMFPVDNSNKEFAHTAATKAPEGATAGGVTGLALGGALGWLAGIGSLAIPGVGPFIAAGPIMAALAGAAAGGSLGGLSGALIGVGIPEYEAKRYEGQVKEGGFLLSVHCDDSKWCDRAEEIFEACGGYDINSSSQSSADSDKSGRPSPKVANY